MFLLTLITWPWPLFSLTLISWPLLSLTLITWLWPLFSLSLIAWRWPLFFIDQLETEKTSLLIFICWTLCRICVVLLWWLDFVFLYFGDCVIYISLVRVQLKSYPPVSNLSLSCTSPVLDSIYLFVCRLYTFVHNTRPISVWKIAEEYFYKWTNFLHQDLQGKEVIVLVCYIWHVNKDLTWK